MEESQMITVETEATNIAVGERLNLAGSQSEQPAGIPRRLWQ
jgi:hypothetical protein